MMYQPARNADPISDGDHSSEFSECEFHRRRAEAEMEAALAGTPLSIALCHLELARLHRERFAALGPAEPPSPPGAFHFIDRTDKEG